MTLRASPTRKVKIKNFQSLKDSPKIKHKSAQVQHKVNKDRNTALKQVLCLVDKHSRHNNQRHFDC